MDEVPLPNHHDSPNVPYSPGPETGLPPGLKTFLEDAPVYGRVPADLRKAWESVQLGGKAGDTVAAAFYKQGGFVAWYVYQRIKRTAEGSSKATNKADCVRFIASLPEDAAAMETLATKVVAALPSHKKEDIKKLQEKMSLPAAEEPVTVMHDIKLEHRPHDERTIDDIDTQYHLDELRTSPNRPAFEDSYGAVAKNTSLRRDSQDPKARRVGRSNVDGVSFSGR
ncbi:serine threonine kinase [Fusarium globosum]|uniref:Serine threonine kinase n=1 Tax=Fusarium globosum TaxID=78864 RepID=A0A8H5XNE8_9HYPO|nr:serine threonine kinase [Fusarium globosum]